MAKKTILRKANTQEIANVNEEYINMAEWTGLNDSTNYTSVDQSSFTEADNVYVDDKSELRNRPPIISTQPFETIECNDLEDNKYKKKIDEGTLGETIYERANSHGSAKVSYEEPINPYDTWYDSFDNTGVGTYDDNDNIVSVLINSYTFTDINSNTNTCTLTYTAECYEKAAPAYIRANNPNTKEDTYYNVTKIIIESTTGLVGQLEPSTGAGVFDACWYVTELDINCYVAGFSYNNMVFSGLGIIGTGVDVNFNGTRLQYSSEIPQYCFYSQNNDYVMPNLKSVTFNTDIRIIGQYAFAYTTLTSLTLPSTIEQVNQYAFANSTALTTLTVLGDTNILDHVFANNTALTTVTADNDCAFGDYCFYNCTVLVTITLPNATEFGKYCFYECNSLTSISATNATYCGDYCFYNCTALVTAGLTHITELGKYCFYECTSLISNNYESLSIVGDYCFYHNLGLTDITIGAPSSIGANAFEECIHLVKVTFGTQCHFTIGDRAFHDCVILETISTISSAYPIPYIDSVGEEAFRACYKLNTLDLTYTQSIGTDAFYNCYELEELTLTNIITLANEAFGGSYLKKVTMGDNLTTIGKYIFNNVTTLEDLTIPFVGPTSDTTEASENTLLGYLFSESKSSSYLEECNQRLANDYYTTYIPRALNTIYITKGNINGTVLNGTVSGCWMLSLVKFGDSVTSLESNVCYACSGLQTVYLGHKIVQLGSNAFAQCVSLYDIYMPATMYYIAPSAFYDDTQLKYVYYEGDSMSAIIIGNNNTYLTGADWIYNYEYEV